MGKTHRLLLVAFVLIGTTHLFASGPSFQPDTKMDGTSLKGWHPFGQADWRTDKGEIVGMPREGAGGWLVLDHAYQDSAYTLNTAALAVASPECFSARKKLRTGA